MAIYGYVVWCCFFEVMKQEGDMFPWKFAMENLKMFDSQSLMKAFDSIDMLNKCVVDLNLVRQVNFKVWLHCSHIGERVEMADKVRIFWWVVRAKGILRLTICTNWIWSGWLSMKLKLDLNGYHEKNLDARLKKLGIYGYSDLSFWYLWTLDVFCGINWLK